MPLLRAGGREFECDAILLDKDGTLLDFKVMWLAWSRYVIDEIMNGIHYHIKRKVMEMAMGIDLAAWYVDPRGPLAGGTMSGIRKALVKVLLECGMAEANAHDLVTEVYQRSEAAMDWGSLTRPLPGLQGQLKKLRFSNFKLAVVTADITERAKTSLNSLGMINYFDVVIGADLVENSKPAPDMALLSCRLLDVKPERAVVIGDTPRDILMAKDAGAGGIGVLSGVCMREQLYAAGADAVIESVTDLS
ncbi:HAD family hydrolase [Desulfoscipio gibsoniae]|uniref:HAD family hydrolase n=1 Tax=Desulfoscipio gibsoniae TaxID=102134 RepID=UPI0012FE7F8A|nr:HAD family hydrolase [Desulfoscipio gibsoniae]